VDFGWDLTKTYISCIKKPQRLIGNYLSTRNQNYRCRITKFKNRRL
jgi:hypothetical protein